MELAFVLHPKLVDIFPVLVIEGHIQHADLFVVERSSAFKLVLFPISLVSLGVIGVIQSTLSVHLVFLPFSNVLSSLIIVKGAVAVSHIVELGAFVLAFEVGFRNVLIFLAGLVDGILDGSSAVIDHAGLLFCVVRQRESVGVVRTGVGIVDDCVDVRVGKVESSPDVFSYFSYFFDFLLGLCYFVLFEAHVFHLHDVFVLPFVEILLILGIALYNSYILLTFVDVFLYLDRVYGCY